MTYFSNIDTLNAEFDYRTEQLRNGLAGRRRPRSGRRTGLARLRRAGSTPRPGGDTVA
ncbi:hypothetical protein [Nocardioides sp.]|uniref:hypothetical protein n=1 Tax=Nocardioides sp. TaxID=35761 RepID=UPI00273529B0|nr:hypothetical protein [Nocardioides sp.]MDP3894161.1 hypothetical protein [Nocardioides sp.]